MHRDQFACTVRENVPLCREHFRLVLLLPEFPPTEPGQFIQLSCRDLGHDYNPDHEFAWEPGDRLKVEGDELLGPLAMLRRPFSLAGRRDTSEGVELDIIHRVVGVGTDWLSRLKPGDHAFILGPLGNRFTLPPREGMAILVGGGVGIPPMLYLGEKLKGMRAVAFCGALSRDLLPLTIRPDAPVPTSDSFSPQPSIEEFARHGVRSVISTDDGSYGFRGFVTQALEKYLDELCFPVTDKETRRHEDTARRQGGKETPELANAVSSPCLDSPLVYTCGPEPMMKRVADIAAARGLACQIAVERAMACGMGTCQSCCIRVRKPVDKVPLKGKDWAYRLACTDGPIFLGSQLLW
jgi:dihydroorotate dehydrogenase electron transfer subunit